ncbi:M23 family metallopeptidase [Kribbella sp. GL6]|uniref:M23 family metallopeptidase n=1 Tax=Kribbella sp. GL6 TaxID=3419765 RepID=UPI003CFC1E11
MTIAFSTPAPPPTGPVAGWPLDPRPEIVHGFELPAKPWLPGHRGVDLAGRPGQPVLAATPGTITYAGPVAGRGVVTITYGARRTTYEPVVADVPVGTSVRTGTVIGRLSAVGSHCLPRACLHWGLLQAKQYLDPLSLLPSRPVRLLPLTAAPSTGAARTIPAPTGGSEPRIGGPQPRIGDAGYRNRRAAKLIIAVTAALTLAAGLVIRRP